MSRCPAPIPWSGEAFYPTPPPSPDLDLVVPPPCLPPSSISVLPLSPPPEDSPLLKDQAIDFNIRIPRDPKPTEVPPLPIQFLLNTTHHLPHASTFRLTAGTGILAALGGNRILQLDTLQSIWDRMPYSAATSTMATPDAAEEDQIEVLVGGERPESSARGLHWALRNHNHEHVNSIFVHPPTPERIATPPKEEPKFHFKPAPTPDNTQSQTASTDSSSSKSSNDSPASTPKSVRIGKPKALLVTQVLPEVRSPPKRTMVMAADSLQINQKRGRRPRLFGFTELPESSGSSAEGSRHTSPERTPSPPAFPASSPSSASSSSTIMGPATSSPTNFIPRRQPVRAKSETSLQTVSTLAQAPAPPPRRRDNGLKLDFEGIIPLNSPSDLAGSVVLSPYSAKLIRKKSGEILKPALKYGGPLSANGTPLMLQKEISPSPKTRFESKSCPSTPSCPKYVHFDAQLERVKLFLHDQKPQVVSREGSPTTEYTTSEGEEYPFPFSSTDEERDERKVLQIKLPNFPTSHAPDTDLFLESLFLDDDRKSLRGIVQCRNFAFQKWVAVRFTFDWWQTTSEVTATHKDSVRAGAYDRFSFLIKLQDILSKIEEKTLFVAIRYNTDGREIWDANGGQNYQVQFENVAPVTKKPAGPRLIPSIQPGMGKAVGGRTSQWSVTGGNADDRLADLRARLSRLTADDMGNSPPQLSPNREATFQFSPSRKASGSNGGSFDSPMSSPRRSFASFDPNQRSELPAAGPSLAARYDFGTNLKRTNKGRRSSNSPRSQALDLPDVRTGLLQYGSKPNEHAAAEFHSPRFSPSKVAVRFPSSDYFFSPTVASPATIDTSTIPPAIDVPDVTAQGPSPGSPEETTPTPLSSLPRRPSISRSSSSPAEITKIPDASNSSPPHLDPSGPGSLTDTPSDSPKSPPDESLPRWSPTSRSEKGDDQSLASYSSFIEQFCWGGVQDPPPFETKRSHSTSSLDRYFAGADNTGIATRTCIPPGGGDAGTPSPSSEASFYTSYSSASTPTTREDMEDVEAGLRSPSPNSRMRGRGYGREGHGVGKDKSDRRCLVVGDFGSDEGYEG